MIQETYLANLKAMRNKHPNAHFEVITRTARSVLAPSKELLNSAKNMGLSKEVFEEYYRPRFIQQLDYSYEAQLRLHELANIAKEKDIFLVCYEKDPSLCHRSLVKTMIEELKGLTFNKTKVQYGTHNLAPWRGECPHNCDYCYIDLKFGRYEWARGEIRKNPKALKKAFNASTRNVKMLVVSFSSDALPMASNKQEADARLQYLIHILDVLEKRKIPTKVLTKNADIGRLADFREPYKHIQIGMSITTNKANSEACIIWEKNASRLWERHGAMKKLEEFRRWASAEPPLPGTYIPEWMSELDELGLEEIWVGKGSHLLALEIAFNWNKVADYVNFYNPQNGMEIHIKKELKAYLSPKQKTLEEFLTISTS